MLPPSPALAAELAAPTNTPVVWTRESLVSLATQEAQDHELNVNHFLATINRESQWDVSIQSQYKKKDGTQERSFGLCQLNLDARPQITVEQADNPTFCLPLMADEFAAGHATSWSAWSQLEAEYGDGVWPE